MNKKEMLQAATLRDEKGRVRGVQAIAPGDRLVTLRPGTVSINYDQQTGEDSFVGLKEGFRLASADDVARKEAEEADRKEAELDAEFDSSDVPTAESH